MAMCKYPTKIDQISSVLEFFQNTGLSSLTGPRNIRPGRIIRPKLGPDYPAWAGLEGVEDEAAGANGSQPAPTRLSLLSLPSRSPELLLLAGAALSAPSRSFWVDRVPLLPSYHLLQAASPMDAGMTHNP